MTTVIALTIDLMTASETMPISRTNRCVSTPRSCSASTAEGLLNPLSLSGISLTCQRLWVKYSFHSVSGATSRMGNTPMASEFTTTTGRVFRISAPRVGSRRTNKTSPRLLSITEVFRLPLSAVIDRLFVVLLQQYCLLRQDPLAVILRTVPMRYSGRASKILLRNELCVFLSKVLQEVKGERQFCLR